MTQKSLIFTKEGFMTQKSLIFPKAGFMTQKSLIFLKAGFMTQKSLIFLKAGLKLEYRIRIPHSEINPNGFLLKIRDPRKMFLEKSSFLLKIRLDCASLGKSKVKIDIR